MKRRIIAMVAAGVMLLAAATGCSMGTEGALAADAQLFGSGNALAEPTKLVSTTGSTTVAEQNASEAAQEVAEISVEAPVAETEMESSAAPAVSLPQLNFGEGYMTAKPLDAIDVMNDKVVALSFDDGPNPTTTPKLLDVLKENGVNATFFVVGENVASNPDIVKRAYEEGNEIGTHSWDHSKNDLKWSHDEVMDQIGRANDAIQQATGLKSIIDRPPEGAINDEVAEGIGRMQILWDVDPNDWKPANRDPDIVYANVVVSGGLRDGSLVLSHDIRETTVDAYDRIIKALKEEGYKFVTVTQLIQIAAARGDEISYIFNGAPAAQEGATAHGAPAVDGGPVGAGDTIDGGPVDAADTIDDGTSASKDASGDSSLDVSSTLDD